MFKDLFVFNTNFKKISTINYKNFFYNIILITFLFFLTQLDLKIQCFSIRDMYSTNYLNSMTYRGINFKYSKTLTEIQVKQAIDKFFETHKNIDTVSFYAAKYYENRNGILVPMSKFSPYSHFNLSFGRYVNTYFNLQFSHSPFDTNFNFFSNKDILWKNKKQYLCNELYIYDSIFNQKLFSDAEINEYFEKNNIALKNVISKEIFKKYTI